MQLPKDRNLRRILAAQLPADFADWLDYVAILTLMTYIWKVDPIYFAWFAVLLAVPYVVVGPIAGALVDRWQIKKIMILANVGRAVTTALLIFAQNIELVLVLVFFRGVIDAFFSPAKQVSFQALADKDELMATNSVSFIINQASKVAGPAVGGALLLWWMPHHVFLANAFLSLIAASMLLGLPSKIRSDQADEGTEDEASTENSGVFGDVVAGLKEIAKKPMLLSAMVLGAVGFFGMFFYDTMIGLAVRDLGFTQEIFGVSIALVGGGGILGAVVLGSIKRPIHPFLLIGGAMLFVGPIGAALGYVLLEGIQIGTVLFLSVFAVVGVLGAGMFVPQRTILQSETHPSKMGRVAAVNEGVSLLAISIAPFLGALVARTFGLGYAFWVGGGLITLTGLVALFMIGFVKPTESDAKPAQAGISE